MNRVDEAISRGLAHVSGRTLGAYQAAVVRIGFSATWLVFLLRELPHRQEMYGPDAPWNWEMARQFITADHHAFTALMWSEGPWWFEAVYAVAVLSSALLLLGWHTRAMSVLFMLGVLSLLNRSVFMGDGGDNVIHIMAIYLVLTRCGRVWSLDARRARRAHAGPTPRAGGDVAGPVLWGVLGLALAVVSLLGDLGGGWELILWGLWVAHGLWGLAERRAPGGQPHRLLDVIATMTHNAGLAIIMAEACLIYATAGWYKIQGNRWQDGTAVYYPLHLDYFSPWPALSHLMAAHGLVVLLVTYGTVIVQVAFPFTLFNRRVKNVLLVAMMCEHAVIAVTLGLPFFSLAMIAADAVFLPTVFLLRVEGGALWCRAALSRRLTGRRLPRPRSGDDRATEPPHGADASDRVPTAP